MNITEADRLVRKIAEVLERKTPAAQARQLAQDYADVCRTTAHRLEQCAAMLERGEEPQALQLAEAPPPLLDLVTRLGFRQMREWREYCQKHDLPVAESLEPKFIRHLGEAYGKGLAPDHQLYRKYREAVFQRDDHAAVSALGVIVRRNPADTNAPRELERLEAKILQTELGKLEAALAAGDSARVISLVQEIEALNFAAQPSGEVWRRGQESRCRTLLLQAEHQRARGAWSAAAPMLALVHSLSEEHDLRWSPDETRALRELDDWVGERQKAHEEDRKFQRTVLELRRLVASREARNADGKLLNHREARRQCEALDRKWREAEAFGRPIDEELITHTRKVSRLLHAQWTQRKRMQRNWAVAGLAAFVLVALMVSIFFWNKRRARDVTAELKSLREARQVVAAERLVTRLREQDRRLARASPALRIELEAADHFTQTERQRKAQCESLIAQLEEAAQRGFDSSALEQTQARGSEAQRAVTEAAEDFQPELNAALRAWRTRWAHWLGERRTERVAEFERQFPAADQAARDGLDFGRGPDAVHATLAELDPTLHSLRALIWPPLPSLRLSAEAETRFNTFLARVTAHSNELVRWDGIRSTWRQPGSIEAYLESLRQFQGSEFAPAAEKTCAGLVLGLNITSSTLLAGLLLPGNTEAWDFFQHRPGQSSVPEEIMPGERSRFNQLRDDENILNLFQCKITQLPGADRGQRKTWIGFARGRLARNKFGRWEGKIFDPVESPAALEFRKREFDNFTFSVEEIGPAAEAVVFEEAGLKGLIDSGTGASYGLSLLQVLDNLNRQTQGSPLFRAFLWVRLHEILELRPHAWNAHWAPSVAHDRQQLRKLGADRIVSGDWLIPGGQRDLAERLERHFEQARRVAYRQQAKFLGLLARRASEAGLVLAGHAGPEGKPALPPGTASGAELWGWAADSKMPALLWRMRESGPGAVTVREALPLTPLFVFRADRHALLAEVRQSVSNDPSELGSYLPPLFRSDHE
ncbi:MAG: hypothetical protein L0Z50_32935 [Verrucomicrobiales bacterium]|nr:hypothetical protein [Verrucomicrobiales bacterium]